MRNIAAKARESGIIPEWPAPPLSRMLIDAPHPLVCGICPDCGSSMKWTWRLKKKCVHPECGDMKT